MVKAINVDALKIILAEPVGILSAFTVWIARQNMHHMPTPSKLARYRMTQDLRPSSKLRKVLMNRE
jgi:hypothetical protein